MRLWMSAFVAPLAMQQNDRMDRPGGKPDALENLFLKETLSREGYALLPSHSDCSSGKVIWDNLFELSHQRPVEIDLSVSKVLTPSNMDFPLLAPDITDHLRWIESNFPAGEGYEYHHMLKLICNSSRVGQADIWHQDRVAYLTFSCTLLGKSTEIAPQARSITDLGHSIVQPETGATLVFPGGKGVGLFADAMGVHRSPVEPDNRLLLVSYLEDEKSWEEKISQLASGSYLSF